jgi:NAD(P)-dependent dehydrogenase (short-subunit alcohol dehydrogenase family)
MDTRVPGMRVLVTGGAAGIGCCIAEAFAAAGASVHVCDVAAESIATFAAAHPSIATSLTDISDRAAVDRMFEDVERHLSGLDVLVNNASISGQTGRVEELDPDDWEKVFAVNVHGTFYCTRRAIPMIKGAGEGAIINISSVSGRLPYAMRSPYSASKWAMVGFTTCLAMELGAYNIRANAILPGIVRGERRLRNSRKRAALAGISVEEVEAGSLRQVAMGRMVEPEEVAQTALFLASPAGRNISGQAISVCGYLQALTDPLARASSDPALG